MSVRALWAFRGPLPGGPTGHVSEEHDREYEGDGAVSAPRKADEEAEVCQPRSSRRRTTRRPGVDPRQRRLPRVERHRVQARHVGKERRRQGAVDERRDDPAGRRRRCAHPRGLRGDALHPRRPRPPRVRRRTCCTASSTPPATSSSSSPAFRTRSSTSATPSRSSPSSRARAPTSGTTSSRTRRKSEV